LLSILMCPRGYCAGLVPLVIVAAVLFAQAGTTFGQLIDATCSDPIQVEVEPIADMFLWSGLEPYPYGWSSDTLKAYGSGRITMLRFPRPAVLTPDRIISSAYLFLYRNWDGSEHKTDCTQDCGGQHPDGCPFKLRAIEATWNQTSLPRMNQYKHTVSGLETIVRVPQDGSKKWFQFGLSDFFRRLYSMVYYGSGDVAFDMAGAVKDSLSAFDSTRGENKPYLRLHVMSASCSEATVVGNAESAKCEEGLPAGAIVGIVIGSVGGALVLACLAIYCNRRAKRRQIPPPKPPPPPPAPVFVNETVMQATVVGVVDGPVDSNFVVGCPP